MNHIVSYFIQCCFRRQRLFQLPLLQLSSFNLPVWQFQKVSALIPTKLVFFKSGTSRLPYITWPLIDTKEKVTGRSIVSNPVKWLSPQRVGEQNSGSEIEREGDIEDLLRRNRLFSKQILLASSLSLWRIALGPELSR